MITSENPKQKHLITSKNPNRTGLLSLFLLLFAYRFIYYNIDRHIDIDRFRDHTERNE